MQAVRPAGDGPPKAPQQFISTPCDCHLYTIAVCVWWSACRRGLVEFPGRRVHCTAARVFVVGPRKINSVTDCSANCLSIYPRRPPVAASAPSYRNVHAGRAPGSRQRHAEYAPRPGEAHGRHAPGGGGAARQRPRRHPCCYLDAGTLRIAATSKSKAGLAARRGPARAPPVG
eukprot:scaffold18870_cov71-Phaeocystis_antarctica.AAC.1